MQTVLPRFQCCRSPFTIFKTSAPIACSLPTERHPWRTPFTYTIFTVIPVPKHSSLHSFCLLQPSLTHHTTWLKAHKQHRAQILSVLAFCSDAVIPTKHSAGNLTSLGISVKPFSPLTPRHPLQDQHLPCRPTHSGVGNLTPLSLLVYCHAFCYLKIIQFKGWGFWINLVLTSPGL